MNALFGNPYEPRCEGDAAPQQRQQIANGRGRHWFAFLLAAIGAPIGAILCSVGYFGIIIMLETAFVPPLHSPANYGQFGFLLVLFGFFGLLYGASFGLIPYTRFFLWVPSFLLISYLAISGEIATSFDVTEVTCTAMIIVGIIIVALAAATSFFLRRRETAGVRSNARESIP
jgi:hypothetical protein